MRSTGFNQEFVQDAWDNSVAPGPNFRPLFPIMILHIHFPDMGNMALNRGQIATPTLSRK